LIFQVLEDSDPEKDAKLLKHAEAYPQEQEPLVDSAISFGGNSRTIPSPQRTFTPVGHICLGRVPTEYEASRFAENEEGLYWISNFYVSHALQGSGLGRAAMDTVENLAISEPLCAKTLALNTINKDDPDREEKYKALGLTIPQARVSGLKRECANSV
jgi:GNAT superfamily N-acetyltransferase